MADAPLILGVSGLRGIVGESLTPEVAVRYAGAFGTWLQERDSYAVVALASDGRKGWEAVYSAAKAGLLASGCRVVELGIQTTPTVGVTVTERALSGAIQVTASHNPQEWNGLKCLVEDHNQSGLLDAIESRDVARIRANARASGAQAPTAAQADEIIKLYHGDGPAWIKIPLQARSEVYQESADDHVAAVFRALRDHQRHWPKFSIAVDSVNASGCEITRRFARFTNNLRLIHLNGDGSGVFPHTPEPTKENLSGEGGLCDAVPGLRADVGFAQDPDADRLAIVDEKGNYIGEEYTLVLCAMALMEAGRGEGRLKTGPTGDRPVFVVNLSTSRMIDDVAARYGAEVVRTPVGEANVVEAMKRLKAEGRDVVMGGEGNGGVIWPEVTYVRDSLSAMALTLALMARTGKKVSELVAMIDAMGPGKQGYCILKRKAPLASKAAAQPVVRHLAAAYAKEPGAVVDTQDGVRIDWPARGVWAHVRASNTEPIMRVIVEAPTEALAAETAGSVEARIAEV